MFEKILIANRGEIACRVMASARKMGIRTVAVYSDADKDALHVRLADEAVNIGPAPSRESYLRADKIIEACRSTGAQAVHPGYGFLSENAEFAQQVEAAGIVFIGPKHCAIAAMGDKIESKKLAAKAGVNCIPGVNDPIASPEQAVEIARSIGYPVMIKASAGGGGKGLRVAYNDQEALQGFTSCQNEARNSFGDDRVFIEKFVQEPRHIEIQVLGDAYGHMVYLHERECSIQRRHQKVIEEAPSPFISEATRRAMGEQAVALAKAVGYQSAGTVEFVVGKDQDFYFLEMNTRLQVEHPVTECITGLDLVEWMIRIAAGEKLSLQQEQIPRNGWAIECRINAEDPLRNFLPSTGRLVKFVPPAAALQQGQASHTYGVRVDTGVQEGGQIPMFYDSMIAKLIVHGRDREDAIARMREALNGFVIRGIHSNIVFQSALLAHPDFAAGRFNTGFIAQHFPKGFQMQDMSHEDPHFLVALAAYQNLRYRRRASGITGQMRGHGIQVGERFTGVVLEHGSGQHQYQRVQITELDTQSGYCLVQVSEGEGEQAPVKAYEITSNTPLGAIALDGHANGQYFVAQIQRGAGKDPLGILVTHNGVQAEIMMLQPHAADLFKLMLYKAPPDMSKFLISPMPGLLVDVAVQAGQTVRAGEKLAVIEAMKMENVLLASQDGVVQKVVCKKGDSLAVDQIILEFA